MVSLDSDNIDKFSTLNNFHISKFFPISILNFL